MNTLDKIIDKKRIEVSDRKELYPTKLLERSIYFETKTVSLKEYLLREDKVGVISEIKRKSPSKGDINPHISLEELSIGYMQAGASALSVLTDEEFFGGTNKDLETARKFNHCPILRKDFTVDEYQIIEAKSIGADAILLIAAALSSEEILKFSKKAKGLGLEVLLEVHSKEELESSLDVAGSVDIIGVNNRNLKDFTVSVKTSEELVGLIPDKFVKISESGISDAQTIVDLKKKGFQGFLIGETFMKNSRPQDACAKLIREVKGLLS